MTPSRRPTGTAARPDRAAEFMTAWRAELPDVVGPSTELTKRILFLAADLQAATRSVLPEFGLTAAEFDVLATLRRTGSPYRVKSNELSRALMLSTGGTANVVNRLAAAGLVQRETDADDGRGTLVRLTAEGVTLAEAVLRANAEAHEQVFAGMTGEAVATATLALRALTASAAGPDRREPGA